MEDTSLKRIVRKDMMAERLDKIKAEPLFKVSDEICLISNCPHERQLEIVSKELESAEETIVDLNKRIEHYKDKIQKRLLDGYVTEAEEDKGEGQEKKEKDGKKKENPKPVTREELLNELKQIEESEDIDILRKKLKSFEDKFNETKQERDNLQKEFEAYKHDQEEVLTNYHADAEITKKVSELSMFRHRVDVINASLAEKELKEKEYKSLIEQYTLHYNHTLVPHYNARVQELQSLNKQVLAKRVELNKLSKLKPARESSKSKPEKKRFNFPFFRRRSVA